MADVQSRDRLVPLGELGDFRVAPGNPDIRGWAIYGTNDAHLGKVQELMVDTGAGKARYLIAACGGGLLGFKRREVIIPIGRARLDDTTDRVYLDNVSEADLESFPDFDRASFDRDQERTLFGGGEDRYAHADYDTSRFLGKRAEGEEYLTLHEERLDVEKHSVPAGEAVVRKHVETEHVRQDVPLMREGVTVERRPIPQGQAVSGEMTINEDEVHIPLMAEEVTVGKHVVATEEVVIKKTRSEETKAVEADLRREKVDVESSDVTQERSDMHKKEPV